MNYERKVLISKSACLPTNLFKTSGFKNIAAQNVNVLIGHNRYATQGAINGVNAHPFKHGDITGVHNGTLRQQSLLPESNTFQVDSENLVYSINKIGSESTYSKLNGAAALVWWNSKEETLHFLRNSERPFSYCYSKDNKTIFWASETWMLEGILGRNKIKHLPIFETTPHTEYVMNVPKGIGFTYKGVSMNRNTKLAPYTFVRTNNWKANSYLPILPKKSTELSSGSQITFRLSQRVAKIGNSYHGFIKGDSSIEVEVLGGVNHPSLIALTDNDLKGTVNSFFRRNDVVYKVLVQANSIIEIKIPKTVVNIKPVTREFHTTSGPEEYSRQEFEQKTMHGCSLCLAPDLPFDSDVMFDEMGNAICEDCTGETWVADYINYIN